LWSFSQGHSLSVSDIVRTPEGLFFVDLIGWKEVGFATALEEEFESLPVMDAFTKLFDKGQASNRKFPEGYLDYRFQSSVERTNEYASFETKFRNYIKKNLPDGFALKSLTTNHFGFSCSIFTDNDRIIKLSIPDVRYFPNEWHEKIHLRFENGKDKFTDFSRPAAIPTLKDDLTRINEDFKKFKKTKDNEM